MQIFDEGKILDFKDFKECLEERLFELYWLTIFPIGSIDKKAKPSFIISDWTTFKKSLNFPQFKKPNKA
jgi:hypothetical protein